MVNNSDIKSKIELLKSGELTCVDNARSFLAEIEKNNEKFNIILEKNTKVIEIAENLDKLREYKGDLGKLHGLCFLVKSNISVTGMTISCASKTLEDYKGSFDADVVKNIVAEGGIILGNVNNDEFANGIDGETSAFGATNNPFSPGRVPGGSSSGSAAAVAANFCDISLGSDTGGSIRNPASHCNVVGVKPSYGRVSRYGLVDLSMSLDQIGPFSKDVYGSALCMEVISGLSSSDATTFDRKLLAYTDKKEGFKPKFGIITEFVDMINDERISKVFNNQIEKLKSSGYEVAEVSVDKIGLAVQAYYPIVFAEFYSGTRKFDGVKYGAKIEDTAGEEVLRRIFGGEAITQSEFDGAYYKKALKVKEMIAEEFSKAFENVDCILSPVTPNLPHNLGAKISIMDAYAEDAFTTPLNLAGVCGGVVNAGLVNDEGQDIAVGVQVISDKFCEDKMFAGMSIIETLNKN
jgi:aspartyl-tRNA(Asn)/glutamyl-tRNA(Gln) amidotransferase subunit A